MTANEDALDLDTWEEIALESERHYGHVGCMECDCGPGIVRALIAELRSARAAIGPDSRYTAEDLKSAWKAGYDEGIATMKSEWP